MDFAITALFMAIVVVGIKRPRDVVIALAAAVIAGLLRGAGLALVAVVIAGALAPLAARLGRVR
jgi:predicted branched-subunit amino acid permease